MIQNILGLKVVIEIEYKIILFIIDLVNLFFYYSFVIVDKCNGMVEIIHYLLIEAHVVVNLT